MLYFEWLRVLWEWRCACLEEKYALKREKPLYKAYLSFIEEDKRERLRCH